MKTATNIKTELWHRVMNLLIEDQWMSTYRYGGYDAGIDFDFIILEKSGEEILFGWGNWFEGEIQCLDSRMTELENLANCKFNEGEIEILLPGVIEINRKWKTENTFGNSIW